MILAISGQRAYIPRPEGRDFSPEFGKRIAIRLLHAGRETMGNRPGIPLKLDWTASSSALEGWVVDSVIVLAFFAISSANGFLGLDNDPHYPTSYNLGHRKFKIVNANDLSFYRSSSQ